MNLLFGSFVISLLAALADFGAQVPSTPAKSLVQEQQAAKVPEHEKAELTAGARIFSTDCAGCHGADARGGERAPNIATRREIVSLSDSDLEAIIRNGRPGSGMPAFAYLGGEGVGELLAYVRVLQGKNETSKITGDAIAGRALFFGKAQCGQCHMMKGKGGFIGSDLTDYAQGKTSEAVHSAITSPDVVVAPTSELVELSLSDGEHVSGLARAEDNFAITLQTSDGGWRTIDKARVEKERHTGRSIHPQDFASRLSQNEINDLASFLTASALEDTQKPSARRSR